MSRQKEEREREGSDKRRSEERGRRSEEKWKGVMAPNFGFESRSRLEEDEEGFGSSGSGMEEEGDEGGDLETSEGLRLALDDLNAFELDEEEEDGGRDEDTSALIKSARDALNAFRSEDDRGDDEFAAVDIEDRGRIRENVEKWEADIRIREREREESKHAKECRPRVAGDDFSDGGIDVLDDLIPDSVRRKKEIERWLEESEDADRRNINPADAYIELIRPKDGGMFGEIEGLEENTYTPSLKHHENNQQQESTRDKESEEQHSRHRKERKRAREITRQQENREERRIFTEGQFSGQRKMFLATATPKEIEESNKKIRKREDEKKRVLEKASGIKRETKMVSREDVDPDLHEELGFSRWKRKVEVELVPGGGMSKKRKQHKEKDEELVEIRKSGEVRHIAKVDAKGRKDR